MVNVGYYNGKIGLIDEMTIPMNDRAVYFGDGVYEAVYVNNKKMFALYDHLDRFYNSLKAISIDFTMSRIDLEKLLQSLIDKLDDNGEAILYWQVSRGTAPRNHPFPNPSVEPNLLAYVKPRKTPDMKNKLKLITTEDIRFLMCNVKTINLLPNILAAQKAEAAGCSEAVFHRGEIVTECSHSNISILKNGVLKTAPLTKYILPGTVRKHMLDLCKTNNIPVDETSFTLSELMEADEIILTSSTALIRSASEINCQPVGGKAPDIVEMLQNQYFERIKTELQI